MSAERQWPDFEWSPEAIEALRDELWSTWGLDRQTTDWPTRRHLRFALNAAVKAQPVVALPPCPTCDGDGKRGPENYIEEAYYDRRSRRFKCPACKGSGVERLVPLSEMMARLERATALAERYGEALVAISAALPNVNKVRVILVGLDSESESHDQAGE